jgi:hypothetical protein
LSILSPATLSTASKTGQTQSFVRHKPTRSGFSESMEGAIIRYGWDAYLQPVQPWPRELTAAAARELRRWPPRRSERASAGGAGGEGEHAAAAAGSELRRQERKR